MIVVAILLVTLANVLADREHKVHNIVLYPERHSWCQTTPIKQIVAMSGYEPVTIDNNVCVGACYSYSIPRTQPAEPGELIGPYCDSCQPLETQCYHVTLHADPYHSEGSKTMQKRVQIIMNCSCSTCNKEQHAVCKISDQNTPELPTNLFSLLHNHINKTSVVEPEIPELLNLGPPKNPPSVENVTEEQPSDVNAKLINLLKSIQNADDDDSNLNYDRDQLKELLEIIEGSKDELSDENLMDFVNFINVHKSEDFVLDLSRLKEVLMKKKDQDLMEKHREFGLGENRDDVEEDIEDLGEQYQVPKGFGIEGNHLGMGHRKGSHIGMGMGVTQLETNMLDSSTGHHHVGDAQHDGTHVGHFRQGPHDSLVLVPDTVEEKLNLDSEEVQPNHEGMVMSYENHHGRHKLLPPTS